MNSMNSIQASPSPFQRPANPPPPSNCSYSSPPDSDLRRQGGHLYAPPPRHSLLPSISVDPSSHYIPPPPPIRPQTNYTDSCLQPIAPPAPVYMNRATGLNINFIPAETVRAHRTSPPTLHRDTSPYDIEYRSRHGNTIIRDRFGSLGYNGPHTNPGYEPGY